MGYTCCRCAPWSVSGAAGGVPVDARNTTDRADFKGTDYQRPEDLQIQTVRGREDLYVATTTTNEVYRIDLASATISVFASLTSINLATGLPVGVLYVNRGEQLQTVGRPHRSHWVRNGHVLKIIWPEEQEARFGIGTHWGFLNIEALPLSWGVLVCTTILCSSTPRRQLSYEPFEPIFRMNDKFELGTSGGSVPEYVRNSVNVDTQPNSLDRALGRVDSMHPA